MSMRWPPRDRRALAATRALDSKEFFETWELFEQVRGSLRCDPDSAGAGQLVEVAGGHGLLAVLFACFERKRFSHLVIADRKRPPSAEVVLQAAATVAPSVAESVAFRELDFTSDDGHHLLQAGGAVVCVHGCKSLTDAVVATSIANGVESLAVMPCCYAHAAAAEAAPAALRRHLGVALAADVQRTYTLDAAGYDVTWRHIPAAITPMNRILVARKRKDGPGRQSARAEPAGGKRPGEGWAKSPPRHCR